MRKELFMRIIRAISVLLAASLLFLSAPSKADIECPNTVLAAVQKAFPGSSLSKCEKGTEDGKQVYEIKLKTSDGHKVKMNLDPAGLVLLTQQAVATDAVPVVVMKSFEGKYPGFKPVRTEKWVYPDGKVKYRVIYAKDNAPKAAIYTSEGVLVEEVEIPADEMDID
jgi:hypothetical protein